MVSRPVPRRAGLFSPSAPTPATPPHTHTHFRSPPHSHSSHRARCPGIGTIGSIFPLPPCPVSRNRHHRERLPPLSVTGVPESAPSGAFSPSHRDWCPALSTTGHIGWPEGWKNLQNMLWDILQKRIFVGERRSPWFCEFGFWSVWIFGWLQRIICRTGFGSGMTRISRWE